MNNLLKTREVCDILGITTTQLYRMFEEGIIKGINVGRGKVRKDWRVKPEDLDRFLKERSK